MIEIKTTNNRMVMKGHAGYEEENKDIVCAAVSILWYSVTEKLRKEDIAFKFYEESGYAEMIVTETNKVKRKIAEMLMDTMICGFEGLQEEYSNYLSLKKF